MSEVKSKDVSDIYERPSRSLWFLFVLMLGGVGQYVEICLLCFFAFNLDGLTGELANANLSS